MPEPIYGLTGPSIAKLRRTYQRLARQPINLRKEFLSSDVREGRPDLRIHFRNASGETMPAWACGAVTGLEQFEDRIQYTIAKPSTTFYRHYIVNGPLDVEDEHFGVAQNTQLVRVLFDTGATPAVGEGWGPINGQWHVKQFYPHTAEVVGAHDDEETLMVLWHMIDAFEGKTAAAHDKGDTGDIDLYDDAGNDISVTIEDVMNRYADLLSGKWCAGIWINGTAKLIAGECE